MAVPGNALAGTVHICLKGNTVSGNKAADGEAKDVLFDKCDFVGAGNSMDGVKPLKK